MGLGRRRHPVAVLALALLLGAWSSGWAGAPGRGAAGPGDALPDISLPSVVDGAPVRVAEYVAGHVAALVYMQTSCAACRKELLVLKELLARYPELRVVAVSVDSGGPARVKRYRDHFGFDFPFLHDPEFKTPELFGFSFTPALVLVDREGRIALLKGGYRPGDERAVEQKIRELLGR